MPDIPRVSWPESSLSLLRDPYRFVSKTCDELGTDVFEARVMLKRVIFMRGREAARMFYDEELFTRTNAAPSFIQKSLFGVGGVQGLDGAAHHHRKAMFLSLVEPGKVEELVAIFADELVAHAREWVHQGMAVLQDEIVRVLTSATCRWTGVPLPGEEVEARTRDFSLMFDKAGAFPLGNLRARQARQRTESWIEDLITRVREGRFLAPEGRALAVIASHRDLEGKLLDVPVAAVELINVIRPIVAVSVFITQAAHALHTFPIERSRLADPRYLGAFVQEVRRYYPFFPVVMARVRRGFEWRGYEFVPGQRVALDLYGTDHHPDSWKDPGTFQPERFLNLPVGPFDLIPQGGGDQLVNHRCPGELVAIELMKHVVAFLALSLDHRLPPQDLTLDMARIPPLPRSRMVLGELHFREHRRDERRYGT